MVFKDQIEDCLWHNLRLHIFGEPFIQLAKLMNLRLVQPQIILKSKTIFNLYKPLAYR